MNKITINGITFEVQGNNISIHNGTVKVDGVEVKGGLSGRVDIKFEGELASLRTDGNVECGNVQGNVDAGGSVHCGNIGGNVDAGGSVHGSGVHGDIDAGGSVTIRK